MARQPPLPPSQQSAFYFRRIFLCIPYTSLLAIDRMGKLEWVSERERERENVFRAVIIIIITNDTLNRFPLYIACNNNILPVIYRFLSSSCIHISHCTNYTNTRTHSLSAFGQCSRNVALLVLLSLPPPNDRRQQRAFQHACRFHLFHSLFDTRRFCLRCCFVVCRWCCCFLFFFHSTLL